MGLKIGHYHFLVVCKFLVYILHDLVLQGGGGLICCVQRVQINLGDMIFDILVESRL